MKQESAWKGSSPEDVTGKQPNPNKAMGNAANRPQEQDEKNKSRQSRMNKDAAADANTGDADDDANDMPGSGKRQDDN